MDDPLPDGGARRSGRTWTGRVFCGVSLDGYIARHNGDIDWLEHPPGGRAHAGASGGGHALTWDTFFPTVDHLVMGRETYEKVLSFGFWPYEGKAVLVLSRTLETADNRVRLVRSVDEAVAALDAAGARQVYVDGGQTVQAFLDADLIDEITTCWAPVLIGEGRPLFGSRAEDLHLTVLGTCATGDGMVHVTYRVHRSPASG